MLLITLQNCLSRCYTSNSFGESNRTDLKLFLLFHYLVKVLLLSQSSKSESVTQLLVPERIPYSINHPTKPCQLNTHSHSYCHHPGNSGAKNCISFSRSQQFIPILLIKHCFHMNCRAFTLVLRDIIIIKYFKFPHRNSPY